MRALILILTIVQSTLIYAQTAIPVDDHFEDYREQPSGGFTVKNTNVRWACGTLSQDSSKSMKSVLLSAFARDPALKLISENETELIYEMTDKTFEAGAGVISGRIQVQLSTNKRWYEVSVFSIIRKSGVVIPIEDEVLNKSKNRFRNNKSTKRYMIKLGQMFMKDFQPIY